MKFLLYRLAVAHDDCGFIANRRLDDTDDLPRINLFRSLHPWLRAQKEIWLSKFGQSHKWIFSLAAARILAVLTQQLDAFPNQITTWKSQLLKGAADVFGQDRVATPEAAVDLKTLHAKIGELALESDFLSSAFGKAGLLSAKR